MLNRFCRYELRTTDTDGARAFYSALFGSGFWGNGIDVAPLPAAAAARGVPPYWLGHIAVEDVVGTAYRFLEAGAIRLGGSPQEIDKAGVVLRDPFGANFALTPEGGPQHEGDRIAWHLLSARDEARAFAWYADILGWTPLERQDLGERGRHVTFTWDATNHPSGSTSDIARQPHVHPQWLFFFHTSDLSSALERVRELDGLTLPPATAVDGRPVAPCDDAQGGAFGLYEGAAAGTRKTSIT